MIAEVSITHELLRRASPAPDYLREKLALQDLAQQMADHPEQLLPHLVAQAMDICDAAAAGISVLEGDVFRWLGLTGTLAAFEGTTTPRDFSPCGVCIDNRDAVLMARPERVYGWIADANLTIPEVLLVPLLARGEAPIGTLWVVAREGQQFHTGHERVMTELAAFTSVALRMMQSEGRLKRALEEQETLTKEMGHRIKNLFAIADSMIRMAARGTQTKQEMADALVGRIHALADAHGLVRESFGLASVSKRVELDELIRTILRPYRMPSLAGGEIRLGEHATNSIALVLHELATNAAKYGALSVDEGAVDIAWEVEDANLELVWRETGGPAGEAPSSKGFGSTLVERTILGYGGKLEHDWSADGLTVRITIPMNRLTG
ncbi:MAG TPA: HWE histidine kinase domain-containing protein [Xanthobacteraceae bacterium]|nr:HWE histidine kinase domain-containing protein [Xanthobacteraceae bacterium]